MLEVLFYLVAVLVLALPFALSAIWLVIFRYQPRFSRKPIASHCGIENNRDALTTPSAQLGPPAMPAVSPLSKAKRTSNAP
jgi:hypothetical protein